MISDDILKLAKSFTNLVINDLNQSVTPFHFVNNALDQLIAKDFIHLKEKDKWNLELGKKYAFSRNNSCLIAFTIGSKLNQSTGCFKLLCAHTDSPNLQLAPNAYSPSGKLERFTIQTYGGILDQTWFDRMLSIAGKLIVKNNGVLETKLINIKRPLMFIPSLPPHLSRENNKIQWSKETHLKPILMTSDLKETQIKDKDKEENKEKDEIKAKEEDNDISKKLGKELAKIVCEASDPIIKQEDLIDYDLYLYDSQSSGFVGAEDEFLASGRLDNLISSIPAVHSLIDVSNDLSEQSSINLIGLFNNEEIGSMTYQGAKCNNFLLTLRRIFQLVTGEMSEDAFLSFCAKSFCISADVNHGFNPNYSDKFQSKHLVHIQGGISLGINPKGSLASDSESAAIIKELAKRQNIPIQTTICRQDRPSGSTIGPVLAALLGIKTVDIGIPLLSMHSIREIVGVADVYNEKRFFNEYFKSYEEIIGNLISK